MSTDHRTCLEWFKGNNVSGRLARWHLTILEFNPTFNYVPEKINVVADGLSRQATSVMSTVVTLDTVSPQQIMNEQNKDPMWKVVIYNLEPGEDTEILGLPLKTSDFVLGGNILPKLTMIEGHPQYCLVVLNSFVSKGRF